MKLSQQWLWTAFFVAASATSLRATELVIHLSGTAPTTTITAQFQCDAEGVKMGLPSGPFTVEYINGAGNALAILPIGANSLIFANVLSGSGARYASGSFIWWDAGARGTTLYSDSLAGKSQSSCHVVGAK